MFVAQDVSATELVAVLTSQMAFLFVQAGTPGASVTAAAARVCPLVLPLASILESPSPPLWPPW